jgi:hypothetical protein
MTPNIIGLYGPSRAGKDEVARILVQDFGYEKRAQADAIRKLLLGLNPLIKDNEGTVWRMEDLFKYCGYNWDNVKAESYEATEYMIRLGQSARNVLGLDVWLNTAFPHIGCDIKVVISDIRQANEYEAIKERGGEVWKIVRKGVEKRGMDGLLDHLHFDTIIHNNGTLIDLRGMVQSIIATNMRNTEVQGTGYGI